MTLQLTCWFLVFPPRAQIRPVVYADKDSNTYSKDPSADRLHYLTFHTFLFVCELTGKCLKKLTADLDEVGACEWLVVQEPGIWKKNPFMDLISLFYVLLSRGGFCQWGIFLWYQIYTMLSNSFWLIANVNTDICTLEFFFFHQTSSVVEWTHHYDYSYRDFPLAVADMQHFSESTLSLGKRRTGSIGHT